MSFLERLVFIKEFRSHFALTGALTPSSRFLGEAIVSEFKKHQKPCTILEVGPGTGVFTREIARYMNKEDQIYICEINPVFVQHLETMIKTDPIFKGKEKQIKIYCLPIQELKDIPRYDYIISSLPLNNFDIEVVKEIHEFFKTHLDNGGTLSYFEYIGLRRLKCYFQHGKKGHKIREMDKLLRGFVDEYQFKHKPVFLNIPPAHSRHLRF